MTDPRSASERGRQERRNADEDHAERGYGPDWRKVRAAALADAPPCPLSATQADATVPPVSAPTPDGQRDAQGREQRTGNAAVWTGVTRHREPSPTLDYGFFDDVPIDPNPLDPHPEHPTPADLVVQLTRSERETRVQRLVSMAWNRYDQAVDQLADKHVVATCALVSGGNDSYTLAHVFRSVTTHHVHANTGTGIEATREFVRAQAAAWGIPLIEVHPTAGQGYFDLVRGTVMARNRETREMVQAWPGGFPGPAAHAVMYQRLKERGLERVRHELGITGSTTQRCLFIAGRRRSESRRRAAVPHFEHRGTTPWLSPFAVWHKADQRAYRLMHADTADPVPVNPVALKLGMSGECGCLANATAGEPDRWREAYPDDPFILAVNAMEAELAPRTDIPAHRKKWGWGGMVDDPDAVEAMDGLCSIDCGPDPIADLMDPLFNLEDWQVSA